MIEIHNSNFAGIRTLTVKGKVVSSSRDVLWKAVQHEVVDEGERQLILDFSEVAECDSFGISELLRLHRSIDNIGGMMVLACLNELLTKVLSITKVDTVFHIAATVSDARDLLVGPDLKPAHS